ncbi:hypothetical protein, partial [Shimia marina]
SAGLDRNLITRKKQERILHPNGPDQGAGSISLTSRREDGCIGVKRKTSSGLRWIDSAFVQTVGQHAFVALGDSGEQLAHSMVELHQ